MRQARGVLPYRNDWVISKPEAEGLFVFITLRPDLDRAGALAWLGRIDGLIHELRSQENTSKERLATVATGFGPSFFTLNGRPRFDDVDPPAGFGGPLPPVPFGAQVPADVIFYVMSVSEAVAAQFLTRLWATRPDVTTIQIERGYQRTDGTEVFGFKDGVRNVPRNERAEVALVNTDRLPEEPPWADKGTYLAYMRIAQDIDRFNQVEDPERLIGRRRDGSRLDLPVSTDPHQEPEFAGPEPPTSCHVRKAGPRGAARDRTRIFRRGLPFAEAGPDGTLHVGLQFVSFQASLDQFRVVFNRWMMNPNFPQPSPGRADDLISQGLITIERWGFYFVPPDTDDPIGTLMFKPRPVPRKPKTGRVAVRKKVLDENGQETMSDLSGFRFRVLAADGQPVGGEFETDSAGHALSNEIPVDTDFTLEELAPPAPFLPFPAIPFRLKSRRAVIGVENRVPPGGGGYNP